MKAGFDYQHIEDYVSSLVNAYGTYSYNTLSDFALDYAGSPTKHWARYTQGFGNPILDLNFNQHSMFFQDEWHITPKLTLSPGVRYDRTFVPQPPVANPAFPETGRIPQSVYNASPRFGLAYQINAKTVFRAGYGIFFNRYIASSIENLFLNNGLNQNGYTLNGTGSSAAAQLAAGLSFRNPLPPRQTFAARRPSITLTARIAIRILSRLWALSNDSSLRTPVLLSQGSGAAVCTSHPPVTQCRGSH